MRGPHPHRHVPLPADADVRVRPRRRPARPPAAARHQPRLPVAGHRGRARQHPRLRRRRPRPGARRARRARRADARCSTRCAGRGMGVARRPRAQPHRRRPARAQPALVGDAARRPGQRRRRAGSTSTGRRPAARSSCPCSATPLDDVVGGLDDRRRRAAPRARSAARWRPAPSACRRRRPLDRQHYRLQWWRDPARNVRRFFTIDDLVGVRVEDPDVAAVVDTVPRLLADHRGVRRRARRPRRRAGRPAAPTSTGCGR